MTLDRTMVEEVSSKAEAALCEVSFKMGASVMPMVKGKGQKRERSQIDRVGNSFLIQRRQLITSEEKKIKVKAEKKNVEDERLVESMVQVNI